MPLGLGKLREKDSEKAPRQCYDHGKHCRWSIIKRVCSVSEQATLTGASKILTKLSMKNRSWWRLDVERLSWRKWWLGQVVAGALVHQRPEERGIRFRRHAELYYLWEYGKVLRQSYLLWAKCSRISCWSGSLVPSCVESIFSGGVHANEKVTTSQPAILVGKR